MNDRTGTRHSTHVVAASDAAKRMLEEIASAARSSLPAYIFGPAGSGRKHAARAVHGLSTRASGRFEVFSARGTDEFRQQSELFGSGDASRTPGAIADARGGTLVLDDVESLSAPVRAQLIDYLKKTSENPSGPQAEQAPRIIVTSGLEPSLSDIRFAGIRLASLEERPECILPLAAHFLALFAAEAGTEPIGFTADARRWLLEEPWHGNIRELGERVRQAVALSGTGAISAEALLLAADGDDTLSFKEAKRAFETRYVECLLRRCRGNISRAARLARKDRKDFYDVIRRTGIEPAQFRS